MQVYGQIYVIWPWPKNYHIYGYGHITKNPVRSTSDRSPKWKFVKPNKEIKGCASLN